MSRSGRLLIVTLALAGLLGCGTHRVLNGHSYDDVWLATQEVLLEEDPQGVGLIDKGLQVAENREESWYWDAVRWLTLGAFGTTGDYLQIKLDQLDDQSIGVRVDAGFDMIAMFVPLRFGKGARQQALLDRIEARLAQRQEKGDLRSEEQLEERYQVPKDLEGSWEEQAQREALLRRQLAARTAAGSAPARTSREREPQHPAPRQPDDAPDLRTVPSLRTPEGMVHVPAGEFVMGTDGLDKDERPRRVVVVDGFYIDRHEVTNAGYREFLTWIGRSKDHSRCHPEEPADKDHTPRTWKSKQYRLFVGDRQPVTGVDWFDAYAYARWRGKRLPTEAEWEKAARGTDGRRFPWDGRFAPRMANTKESGTNRTIDVGQFPGGKSVYGALDMAGNAWEWCYDWYSPSYGAKAARKNPQGPAVGRDRVIRGGSWAHPAAMARTSSRNFGRPLVWSYYIGFRCARSAGR